MMWRILQLLIIGGVMAASDLWQWTPNPSAVVVAAAAAFVVTRTFSKLLDALHLRARDRRLLENMARELLSAPQSK
jgi:cell pole-organizing protein PopZ